MSLDGLDQVFQDSLDEEVKKLASCSIEELLDKDDYGSFKVVNQEIEISIGWWKWQKWHIDDNTYHIVLQAQRKLGLGFYRNYLSGIKFDVVNGTIESLSDEEIVDYD